MENSSPRVIAHIDMDAFFASLEAARHPEWKNEPIIVCVFSGRTEESGVVSSASYDARKQGVKAAMPIVLAKQKCPNGHFVGVDHAHYSQISEEIFTQLFSYADAVEIASIDEAYADLTKKSGGDWKKAEALLREFQSEIKKQFRLTCSIGLSSNKLVAKIASDQQKPSGFTIVLPDSIQSFLDPLPVNALMGVGPKTQFELNEKKMFTIQDIRVHGMGELVSYFGNARGHSLFQSARGIDASPLETSRDRKQHSRIWTLVTDAESFPAVQALVKENASALWEETASKGQFFTQLGVIGISSRMEQVSKSKTFQLPLVSLEQFIQELEFLFSQLFETAPLPLRRMGIRVGGFASAPKQKRLGDF